MRGSGGLRSSPNRSSGTGHSARVAPRGFSLIDILVSLAIVALLMGILLPSLGRVREIARQAVCSSNARQIGLGVHMFAGENLGALPKSQFLNPNSQYGGRSVGTQQRHMVLLRLQLQQHIGSEGRTGLWDGVGKLYAESYIPASAVFYCPSHRGEHPIERYAESFSIDGHTQIISNYQYRGVGPNGQSRLHMLEGNVALVADALAGEAYFNHVRGFNILSVDGSVRWFADSHGALSSQLAETATAEDDTLVGDVWGRFDQTDSNTP